MELSAILAKCDHTLLAQSATWNDIIHQNRIIQKVFRNEFRTERITGHQYGFTKADFIQ